jgi:hypothetical protein
VFQPIDQPPQVGRHRIVQHIGVDPRQIPRDGEPQGTANQQSVVAV